MVDNSQIRAIGYGIQYASRYMDGKKSLRDVADRLAKDMEDSGTDVLAPHVTGDLACFRGIDLIQAINRMRTLRVEQI